MPHCIVEHSASLNAELILPLVFEGAVQSSLFDSGGKDIKVRAMAYQHYLTGPEKADFIHVMLRILSGRTPEQKYMLSALVLAKLQQLQLQRCSLTVEIVDMDRASYSKWIS